MNFLRGLLFIAAACVAYVGYEESRLRLLCPEPWSLKAAEAGIERNLGPVWVHIRGSLAPTAPVVLAREWDQRGVWLALSDPDEPEEIPCVLEVASLEEAKSLQSLGGPLYVSGLARYPSPEDETKLRATLLEAGLRMAPRFRIIDLDRQPRGLPLAFTLFGAGVVVALACVLGLRLRKTPVREQADKQAESNADNRAGNQAVDPREALRDDVKREVERMLADVWKQTE